MRKLCGSIRRIAVFFMVVMLTVQTATVTPVFAEGQDNKLQVEIFVTKHDDRGTSREDFYYIGKANITYPANVSLDAIYDDILKHGKNELSWSDAQRYGVKVDFDIQNDEFATEKNCQGSKQYNKLDNIKSDEEKEMNESFSWLRIRRRKIGHWHIDGALDFTKKQTYKVTFRDADGTILDEQDVKEGESAKAPSNPTKEGYTFTGWDKSLDNISGDTDITAEYEVIKNKVTFEDENGNKIKDVEVEYNGSVSEDDIPQAPEKEGYTFVGWDTDLDNITEDITVRPKYEKNEEPEQPTEPTKPEQPKEPTKPEQPEIPGVDDGNTSDDNNGNNNNASDDNNNDSNNSASDDSNNNNNDSNNNASDDNNNDSNNSASDDNNNDSNNNASDNAPSNNVPSDNAVDSTPAAANIPAQANTPAPAASVPSSPSNDTPADNSSNDVSDANNVADAANNNQDAADDSSTDNSNADGSENDNTNDAGSTDNNRNNRNNTNGRNNTSNTTDNNRRNTNNRNNANNTNDDANAPVQNNTIAVANLIPQNNDTQDAVANINDEQPPLAAGDENADTYTNTSNGDDKVVTTIADDDTPLAAAEDNCIIHWIILLLTLLGAGYTIIRVVLANKQEQEEENKQEA